MKPLQRVLNLFLSASLVGIMAGAVGPRPQTVAAWAQTASRTRPATRSFVTIPRSTAPVPTWTPDESQPLPAAFDAGRYYVPARDQGSRGGMCVSFATCAYLDAFQRFQGYPDTGILSPLYVNYVAGNAERMRRPGHAWSDGVAVESAFAAAVKNGVPPDALWPYETGKAHVPPPNAVNIVAFRNRITGLASLSASARNATADAYGPAYSHYDLHLLKRAIQQRAGFVFAFSLTGEGLYLVNGVLAPAPGPTPPGSEGHCVVAVAYDDRTQLVRIQNSFGPGWSGSVRYGDIVRPEWAYSLTVASGINGRR